MARWRHYFSYLNLFKATKKQPETAGSFAVCASIFMVVLIVVYALFVVVTTTDDVVKSEASVPDERVPNALPFTCECAFGCHVTVSVSCSHCDDV